MGWVSTKSEQDLTFLRSELRAYYVTATLQPVGGFKFRHFRFRTLSGAWVGVRRDISNSKKLSQLISRWNDPPRDLYATALKFLFPKEVRGLTDGVPCLGGPLVFDLDAIPKYVLPSQAELERVKRYLLLLKDWIRANYGYRKFSYVFSGHRGFHLYVTDFNLAHHVPDLDPRNREAQEQCVRTRIAYTVRHDGFPIDTLITRDTRRIIRIPNSLHGHTGLKAVSLPTARALENFHLTQAIYFDDTPVSLQITRPVPIFHFDDVPYGTYRPGQQCILPKAVAYLLIFSNHALANTSVPVATGTAVDEDFFHLQLGELAGE